MVSCFTAEDLPGFAAAEAAMLVMMQVACRVGVEKEHLQIPTDIAPELQDLLEKCWGEPDQRPDFAGILDILESMGSKHAGPSLSFQSQSMKFADA